MDVSFGVSFGVSSTRFTHKDQVVAIFQRLLKKAQKERVVRIAESAPWGVFSDIEEEQSRFGLRDAIISDCVDETESEILQNIGASAAYYLEDVTVQGAPPQS